MRKITHIVLARPFHVDCSMSVLSQETLLSFAGVAHEAAWVRVHRVRKFMRSVSSRNEWTNEPSTPGRDCGWAYRGVAVCLLSVLSSLVWPSSQFRLPTCKGRDAVAD